jgi:hypothetical protein
MNKNNKIGWTISERVDLMPINFTERALKYLYVDKLDPKDKFWILLPGGVVDYNEPNSKVD